MRENTNHICLLLNMDKDLSRSVDFFQFLHWSYFYWGLQNKKIPYAFQILFDDLNLNTITLGMMVSLHESVQYATVLSA